MKSLLITTAIILCVLFGGLSLLKSDKPGAGSAGVVEQIQFRDQATLMVEITNQINAMRQAVAMGSAEGTIAAVLAENDELKQRVAAIEQQRRKSGDGDAAIAQLRAQIGWDEFLRQDATLRTGR